MNALSYLKSILTVSVVVSVMSAPCFAEPSYTFQSLPTDQDAYPANFPYTYNASQSKVLNVTSSGAIQQSFVQLEYPDLIAERQFNVFRAMTREMYDLQTLGDTNIRTRDLASAYTTSLSEFCGYYLVTGASYPASGTPNAAGCAPAAVSIAPPVTPTPAPTVFPTPAPVPALW